MGSDAKMQLKVLRDVLGKRRYRVALLRYGQNLEASEIARRLGICDRTVRRDLEVFRRVRSEITQYVERERMIASRHFRERIAAYAMN